MGPATLYYELAVLGDGPLAFYRLNGNGNDSGNRGLNITDINGSPTYSQAISPTIRSGDGATGVLLGSTNTDYLGVVNTIFKPPQFSIEAWCKPSSLANNDNYIASFFRNTGGKNKGYYLDCTGIGGGNAYFFGYGTIDLTNFDLSSTIPVVGTWVHIVGKFDGVNGRMYINGVLVATSNATTSPIDYSTITEFTIGNYKFTASSSINFNGTIYGVAVYDKPLSAQQVAIHYLAGTAPFNVISSTPTANPIIVRTNNNPVPLLAPLGNSVTYGRPDGANFIIALVDDDYGAGVNNPVVNGSGLTPTVTGFPIDNSNDYFFNNDDLIGDGNRCDDDDNEDEDDDEFLVWDKTNTGT